MILIHRYILRSVFISCLGAVLMFSSLIILGEMLRDLLVLLVDGRLGFSTFASLILLTTPYVFIHALPLGMLTGILLALGRISADSEVVALRSAGMSVMRMSSSVIVLALLCAVLSLYVNLEYGPRTRSMYRDELSNVVRSNPLGFLMEKTFVKDFPGYIVYVGAKNGPDLEDFWVWELDEQSRATRFIRAESGRFDLDMENRKLSLHLTNGTFEYNDPVDPENFRGQIRQLSFKESSLELPLEGVLGPRTSRKKIYWTPYFELMSETKRLQRLVDSGEGNSSQNNEKLLEAKMAIHEKLAQSFATLSLSLIAIPLGIVTKRKETSANLFIALALGILYYVGMAMTNWVGSYFTLKPYFLFWVPNLIFQIIGLFMIYRMDNARWSVFQKLTHGFKDII